MESTKNQQQLDHYQLYNQQHYRPNEMNITNDGSTISALTNVDSGFNSTYNLTLSSNDSSFSPKNLANDSHKNSYLLETIPENIEMDFQSPAGALLTPSKLTPTTRNIKKINEFHITTPVSDVLCRTPKKKLYEDVITSSNDLNYFKRTHSPYKLINNMNFLNNTRTSPYPKRRLIHCMNNNNDSLNKQLIFTSTDDHDFKNNIENQCSGEISLADDKISPIILNKSTSMTRILKEQNQRKFERNFSEGSLPSSTPKGFDMKLSNIIDIDLVGDGGGDLIKSPKQIKNFSPHKKSADIIGNQLTRKNIFRKTQSFSPSKYLKLTNDKSLSSSISSPFKRIDHQKRIGINITDMNKINGNDTINPVKKLLSFSNSEFDNLLKNDGQCPRKTTPKRLQRQDAISDNSRKLDVSRLHHEKQEASKQIQIKINDKSIDTNEECINHIENEDKEISIFYKTFVSNVSDDFTDLNSNECKGITSFADNFSKDLTKESQEIQQESSDILPNESTDKHTEDNNPLSISDLSNNDEKQLDMSINVPNGDLCIASVNLPLPILKENFNYSINQTSPHDIYLNTSIIIDSPDQILSLKSPVIDSPQTLLFNITSPKKTNRCTQKRSSSIKSIGGSPAKMKLITPIIRRRRFYDSFEKLDMLYHLSKYKPAINLLFKYLSDQDLINVSMVSKKWHFIIENDLNANLRRSLLIKSKKTSKENKYQKLFSKSSSTTATTSGTIPSSSSSTSIITSESDIVNRKPFSQLNVIDKKKRKSSVDLSPPVSPSKRKFHENQKLIKKLESNSKITRCPRCRSSSVIKSAKHAGTTPVTRKLFSSSSIVTSPQKDPITAINLKYSKNKFTKTYSCPPLPDCSFASLLHNDSDNNSNDFFTILNNNNKIRSINDSGFSDLQHSSTSTASSSSSVASSPSSSTSNNYAECLSRSCGFKFCVKCLCEFKSEHYCPDILGSYSPTKEDTIRLQPLACSKKSKRNLLRL